MISRDDSSLIPANVGIGRAFLCSKAVAALAAGDSVYPLSATVIGFTRDKSQRFKDRHRRHHRFG